MFPLAIGGVGGGAGVDGATVVGAGVGALVLLSFSFALFGLALFVAVGPKAGATVVGPGVSELVSVGFTRMVRNTDLKND